jgi:hypothetical protein
MSARAEQVASEAETDRGLDVFSRRSVAHGGKTWTTDVVRTEIHLYRAMASGHPMLAKDGRPDHRIPVDL